MVHVVAAGDTLFAIAQQYDVTVQAIVDANRLADPDQIAVGQELVIPLAPGTGAAFLHVVQPGDTLSIIARRYNTTVTEVAQLNRLTNPALIHVGQRLELPPREAGVRLGGAIYVVQQGDTMANIAAHYGVTVWEVAQANHISNPNLIRAGQRLLLPV